MKYLIPFFLAFIASLIILFFLIKIGKKMNWRERKGVRHIHKRGVLRLGGVAMAASFIAVVLFNRDLFLSPEIIALLLGSLALAIFGIIDDIGEIYWKNQLFFQIASALFIFVFGIRIYYITNPLTGGIIDLSLGWGVAFSVVVAIFWILLVINSINWVDGVDGLSGGISFIAAMTIFFLSLKAEVFQPPVAILAAALSGSILAFLIFNFNPAKIIAGTSGSFFMGFSIAALSILAGTKIATALLVLAIPIIDLVWVIRERLRKKRSVFRADRSHLHYKLVELGWSQRQISLFYWGVTILISAVALNTRAIGKGLTLVTTLIVMAVAYFFINRKISEYRK